MNGSGSILWPAGEDRSTVACAVAGVLAEHGVQTLTVADPRFCQTASLAAGKSDLPRALAEAAAGTTFQGDGVAILVDEHHLRFVATEPIATALQAVADELTSGRA